MRLVFRADASRVIGSGHVMRISVLAEEAISRGHSCVFIGRINDLGWVYHRIRKLDFEASFEEFQEFENNPADDVLILDSYSIPRSSVYIDPSKWKLIATIVDKSTPSYNSNILIKPSLEKTAEPSSFQKILSGPDFSLIRKSITKKKFLERNFGLQRLIISGGGTDINGFSVHIAQVLNKIKADFQAHFFTNEKTGFPSNPRFVFHKIGEDFDLVAQDADIAFTTASTSSLEFIAREIPTGVVCAVENQKDYYEQLGLQSMAIQIGEFSKESGWRLDSNKIENLISDIKTRDLLREKMNDLIDLKGPARIISEIELQFLKRYSE